MDLGFKTSLGLLLVIVVIFLIIIIFLTITGNKVFMIGIFIIIGIGIYYGDKILTKKIEKE